MVEQVERSDVGFVRVSLKEDKRIGNYRVVF